MTAPNLGASSDSQLIPEFCRGRVLGMLVVAMELVACVLTLAGDAPWTELPLRLMLLSLYLQWIGISCAAVLCLCRRWMHIARVWVLFLACWLLLVTVIFAISAGAWVVLAYGGLGLAPHIGPIEFLLRNVGIGAVVSLLLLRYFWERNQWLEETRAQSEARYASLQSRIHPHFLFNALNSLAALIWSRPQVAEAMVEDLADLFRISLDTQPRLVTLAEELQTVLIYLRIERLRLGDRMKVDMDIAESLMSLTVPRLTLQPLVENAVLHGIARLSGSGVLHIRAWRDKKYLSIEVVNPLPPENAPTNHGTGMGTQNIIQRLHLIYNGRAGLQFESETGRADPKYRACLRLPLDPPVMEFTNA